MISGGVVGDVLLVGVPVACVAVLVVILRDEAARAASALRRGAAVAAVALMLGAGWLLLGQLQVADGVTCSFWPATDVFGPDGSAVAVASQPAGSPRELTRQCITKGKVRSGGAVVLTLLAGSGYALARRRTTGTRATAAVPG